MSELLQAKAHLENSEELFRVGLVAKNDEISQLNEELRVCRREVESERRLLEILNRQLAAAKTALDEKQEGISITQRSNEDLAFELQSIQSQIDTLLRTSELTIANNADETHPSENDNVHRECFAMERDLVVKEGLLCVIRKMILSEEEAGRQLDIALSERFAAAEGEVREKEGEVQILREEERALMAELAERERAILALREQWLAAAI